tara:strand:+ start:164 stop:1006 length:843 start_codon:yes stop_codon:yes gene_type:complete
MKKNSMNSNYKLLNLACGSKTSSVGDWSNVDFFSPILGVLQMDILKGLKFQNNTFDVVYTAQFIEHITLDQAAFVLKEVNRVLKPGGTLRIVTPDLEEMAESYLSALKSLKTQNNFFVEKQYEWLRLEIFDQVLRDSSGGEMVDFFQDVDQAMDKYLIDRIGHTYVSSIKSNNTSPLRRSVKDVIGKLHKVPQRIKSLVGSMLTSADAKVGKFRRSGEVHLYVHDLFSLTRILSQAGFVGVSREDAYSSTIFDWEKYHLDIVDGLVDAPVSLYVEAKKPS